MRPELGSPLVAEAEALQCCRASGRAAGGSGVQPPHTPGRRSGSLPEISTLEK